MEKPKFYDFAELCRLAGVPQSSIDYAMQPAPMTPEERFAQRVSFVYGQLHHSSPLTKEEVRRMLKDAL